MPRISTNDLREIIKRHEGAADETQRALYQRFAEREMLKKYSMRNLILIFSQFPEAVHVAGFTAWKAAGRSVKKGERGIGIYCPVMGKRAGHDEDGATLVNVRVGYVFDISQTEPISVEAPAFSGELV